MGKLFVIHADTLQPVERNEYAAFLNRLGRHNVQCRIDDDRLRTVTEYTRDQVVVARSVCRRTPLGRIVDIYYGILKGATK